MFVIVNAILLKFTEQIGPYIFKRVKKNQLARRGSLDVKLSDAVKQAKTRTIFEVSESLNIPFTYSSPAKGTYADYLTIFEQYGYVALFSAVSPPHNG